MEGGKKASQDKILIIRAPDDGENDVDFPDYENAQAEAMEGINADSRALGRDNSRHVEGNAVLKPLSKTDGLSSSKDPSITADTSCVSEVQDAERVL